MTDIRLIRSVSPKCCVPRMRRLNRISNIRGLMFAALLAVPVPGLAELFTWSDPETGATMMAGRPPAWYSSKAQVTGPRVVVTVRDRLIDDTALPMESRVAMRRPGGPAHARQPVTSVTARQGK